MTRAIAMIVVVATSACIIPPTESSIGAAATHAGTGYRSTIGVHSASASAHDDADLDLGAGWIAEGGRDRERVDGTYVALAGRLPAGARRWWIGGRLEQFWGDLAPLDPHRGVVARAAYRYRVASGAAGSSDAAVLGTFAIGVYAEAGARTLAGGDAEVFTSIGVVLDLPMFGGSGGKGAPVILPRL